jgi:hypothetical protein
MALFVALSFLRFYMRSESESERNTIVLSSYTTQSLKDGSVMTFPNGKVRLQAA